MARYIDTEHLFKCETCRHYTEGEECNTFCDSGECYSPSINKLPTADVVPKSEVDLYKKQVDELEDELASAYDKLEKIKTDEDERYIPLYDENLNRVFDLYKKGCCEGDF